MNILKELNDRSSKLTDFIGKCYVQKPDPEGKTYQADLIHLANGLENIGWKVEFRDRIRKAEPNTPVFGDLIFTHAHITQLIPDYTPLSSYPAFALDAEPTECIFNVQRPSNWLFQRKITEKTGAAIRKLPLPIFVKSTTPKKMGYSGAIINSDIDLQSETPVYKSPSTDKYWVSDALTIFSSEWRVLVCEGEFAGIAPYILNDAKDIWFQPPDSAFIKDVIKLSKHNGLCDYCFDVAFASTSDKQDWVVIEFNDGYAFGNYGFDDLAYAQVHINWWFNTMKKHNLI